MGKPATNDVEQPSGNADKRPNDKKGSTKNTQSGTTRSGGGRGGIEGITINDGEEKSPGLVDVNEEKTVPSISEKAGKKKRKTTSKSKPRQSKDEKKTAEMTSTAIKTVFDISSIRAGNHWKLSKEECDAISEPLTQIMERYDITEIAGEYGDFIALATVLGMVITPRILYQLEVSKTKKGGASNVSNIQTARSKGAGAGTDGKTGSVAGNSRESNPAPPQHGTGNVKQLLTETFE